MRERAVRFTKSELRETTLEYALIAAGISVGVMMMMVGPVTAGSGWLC